MFMGSKSSLLFLEKLLKQISQPNIHNRICYLEFPISQPNIHNRICYLEFPTILQHFKFQIWQPHKCFQSWIKLRERVLAYLQGTTDTQIKA